MNELPLEVENINKSSLTLLCVNVQFPENYCRAINSGV